jgi:hypothetical protein
MDAPDRLHRREGRWRAGTGLSLLSSEAAESTITAALEAHPVVLGHVLDALEGFARLYSPSCVSSRSTWVGSSSSFSSLSSSSSSRSRCPCATLGSPAVAAASTVVPHLIYAVLVGDNPEYLTLYHTVSPIWSP